MDASEEAYTRINAVAVSLAGLIGDLASQLDQAAARLGEYRYKPFYDFANRVRAQEVEAVSKIAEEGAALRAHAVEMLSVMGAGEAAQEAAEQVFDAMQQRLEEAIDRCRRIAELEGPTDNAVVPDASDEIYELYGRYQNALNEHAIDSADSASDEDALQALVEGYYEASAEALAVLHSSYDQGLRAMGAEVSQRERQATNVSDGASNSGEEESEFETGAVASPITRRPEAMGPPGTGKVGLKAAKAVQVALDPDKGIAETAIAGLAAAVALGKSLEPKLRDAEGDAAFTKKAKSLARGFFKAASGAKAHLDLSSDMLSAVGFELSAGEKLFFGAVTKVVGAIDVQKLKDSGALDMIKEASGLGKDVWAIVKTPASVISTFKSATSAINHAVNLAGAMASYVQKAPPKRTPTQVLKWLDCVSAEVKAYDERLDAYRKAPPTGLPRKKPKAPPSVRVVKLFQKIGSATKAASTMAGEVEDFMGILSKG